PGLDGPRSTACLRAYGRSLPRPASIQAVEGPANGDSSGRVALGPRGTGATPTDATVLTSVRGRGDPCLDQLMLDLQRLRGEPLELRLQAFLQFRPSTKEQVRSCATHR